MNIPWPKKPIMWIESNTLFVSVPFTWNLPALRQYLQQRSAAWDGCFVGGPAVQLMPEYLSDMEWVTVASTSLPGVLQRVNPMATRTTEGCIRHCPFCGIGTGKIENGGFRELDDWPDLPILCDNNILAASQNHFDRVMDRLEKHVGVDFNQGLDARLLNAYHAHRFSRLKQPAIRLSCDSDKELDPYADALGILLRNGVKKSWVSTYALIGFDDGPGEAWSRCELIQKDTTCLPMWFHGLDCLEWNQVTPEQLAMGWSNRERILIMRRFYKAKFGGYRSRSD